MTKFIKDSPIITGVQKATRKARKAGRNSDSNVILFFSILVAPLTLLEIVLDKANKALEDYIERQESK